MRCVAVLALSWLACVIAAAKPNIVVIMADDQGWGDLSSHGNENLRTPHLDRLAAQGATFERFYVQPVCAPTRAELLTGRYHPRVGVSGVSEGRERLDPNVPTLADGFQSAGYATGAFGKWHNGTQAPYHPLCRGFDEFYGFTSGHWGHYFDFWLDRNGTMVRGKGYTTDDFTNEAIAFIERHRDEPFFAYVAYNTPHSPMQVPERFWDASREIKQRGTRDANEDTDHTRAALAMVESIDANVGRLLERLESLRIAENTIVVYLSDNGPNGHRWTDGLRGTKGSTDEGGVRSPLMIRWPRRIEAGRIVGGNAAVIDLLPTLAELASIEVANRGDLDGTSLAGQLTGNADSMPKRQLFTHWAGRTAVRDGSRLLNADGRLYDLGRDPGQQHDLSAEQPETAERLSEAIRRWREKMRLGRDMPEAAFTVGHPSLAVSQLPARDATPHGAVQRSNHYPNCTYFDGWSTQVDRIDWRIEVVTPGQYIAHVYAGVPDQSVGTGITLRTNEGTTSGTLASSTDTTLIGQPHDRVPRKEGDVMNFQRQLVGTIDLRSGEQTLSLSATPAVDSKGPAIWLLTLTRSLDK